MDNKQPLELVNEEWIGSCTYFTADLSQLGNSSDESNKDILPPSVKSQKELEEKVIQAKLNVVSSLMLLHDVFFVEIQEFSQDSTITLNEVTGSSTKSDLNKNHLMICLESSSLSSYLEYLCHKYGVLFSDNSASKRNSESAILSCQKQFSGLWNVHIGGCSKISNKVTHALLESLILKQSYIILIGSISLTTKVVSYTDSAMELVILGEKLAAKIKNITNVKDFSKKYCELVQDSAFYLENDKSNPITSLADLIREDNLKTASNFTAIETSSYITDVLRFQKREISCIIGTKGHRLNSIRDSTGCRIQVLPNSTDSSVLNSVPGKSIFQSVVLTGSKEEVIQAKSIINHYITCYRASDNKFI